MLPTSVDFHQLLWNWVMQFLIDACHTNVQRCLNLTVCHISVSVFISSCTASIVPSKRLKLNDLHDIHPEAKCVHSWTLGFSDLQWFLMVLHNQKLKQIDWDTIASTHRKPIKIIARSINSNLCTNFLQMYVTYRRRHDQDYQPSLLSHVCMSACLHVCLSIFLSLCLCVCLSVYMSVYVSVYMFVCLSVCVSFCLSACMSDCLSVCMSVCLVVCLAFCLSISLLIFQSVCLSMCLSVCPSVSVNIQISATTKGRDIKFSIKVPVHHQ